MSLEERNRAHMAKWFIRRALTIGGAVFRDPRDQALIDTGWDLRFKQGVARRTLRKDRRGYVPVMGGLLRITPPRVAKPERTPFVPRLVRK